jgi:signal transduction histidine kinase
MTQNPAPQGAGILIVDDDQANLAALEAVLAPLGQRVVRAASGREALRHLLHQRFALVLLDVRMQDMDGFEVASLIRARPSTQATPIIFVTAFHEAEESIRRAYRLGAADFIFKPYAPEFLRAKVGVFVELYNREQAISELLVQAQEASRVKSDFLNMAAHELRTPLSVVIGYLSMLSDGSLGEPPPNWVRPLEMLNLKTAELNKIVEDLLAAARLAGGAFPEEMAECDLGQLAREAVERMAPRAELMTAETHVEVPNEPVVVRADAVHVSRILDNLLNNALTYTRGQPWIRLTVGRRNGDAIVEIEDHGIGIPEHAQERIFERFFRANDPRVPPHPGTGLGLYISRELAQRHNGKLVVAHSTPGSGSTLSLMLPVADPRPQVAASSRRAEQ